jgi:hypothetical protein
MKVTVAGLLGLTLLLAACGAGSEAPGLTTGSTSSTGSTDATATPSTSSNQGTSVTDVTMPPPDSPNIPVYQALGWDRVYVLYWLQRQDGWAYVHGIPFSTTEGPTIDMRALLRQDASGEWQVVEKSTNKGLLTDVGQVAVDEEIPARFSKVFPEAPAAIFPEVIPEERLIMNGVRAALGDPGYRFNVFLLNHDQGWAYTELRALRYLEGYTTESREERALLRNVDGTWTVQAIQTMSGTSQSDFAAALRQRFPDLPAGIVP